ASASLVINSYQMKSPCLFDMFLLPIFPELQRVQSRRRSCVSHRKASDFFPGPSGGHHYRDPSFSSSQHRALPCPAIRSRKMQLFHHPLPCPRCENRCSFLREHHPPNIQERVLRPSPEIWSLHRWHDR